MSVDLNAKILVTGAHGGLGQALLACLDSHGFTNVLAPSKKQLDLLDVDATRDFIKKEDPVIVLHLASVVFGLLGNIENQMRSLGENTVINSNLFSSIETSNVKYIFFAGTVASYPYPYSRLPLLESDFFKGLPHRGEFGYAMAKRHAYPYLEMLKDTRDVKFTYGIFTNLYGRGDRFNERNGHVIPSLIMKAHRAKREGMPLTVWGNGTAKRDFLHFNDAAEAIVMCLKSGGSDNLINISSGVALEMGRLSEIIAGCAEIEDIVYLKDKPIGISERVVDNSILRLLGFEITVPIEDGISDLYRWYCDNLNDVRE